MSCYQDFGARRASARQTSALSGSSISLGNISFRNLPARNRALRTGRQDIAEHSPFPALFILVIQKPLSSPLSPLKSGNLVEKLLKSS